MNRCSGPGAAPEMGRPPGVGEHPGGHQGEDAVARNPGSPHPGFFPYRRLRDELLGLCAPAWVARCNDLAIGRGLRSATGAPLRFVLARETPNALGYEGAILHEGVIACRATGRGALHDLHNALVWLTFPRIKATLNRLHLERLEPPGTGRGRLRDAVTLLDESGMLWLSNSALLDAQLLARDWHGLMVTNRRLVSEQVLPLILGHGLLVKVAAPYKALTAHCLIVSGRWSVDGGAEAGHIDAELARRIEARFSGDTPPALAPLPIMGLPGWDPANHDKSYYEDTHVFRSARRSG